MKKHIVRAGILIVAIAVSGTALVTAQRPSQPAPYRAPRTPFGEPDLQGIWQAVNSAAWDIQAHSAHLDVPAGMGVVEGNEIPYQPWALAQKQKNYESRATADPDGKCYYPGVPRIMYMPYPFQIVQDPRFLQMFFEYGHHTRVIYTNGIPHHEEIPFWMGDSRGKWDGETFVIDTKNYLGETWFDKAGNFHSDALHVVERMTRTGPDHLRYEATIEDPKVFTRPWKMSMPLYRRLESDLQILEYECLALQVYEGGRYKERIENARPPGR